MLNSIIGVIWNFGASLHIATKRNSVGQEALNRSNDPNIPSIRVCSISHFLLPHEVCPLSAGHISRGYCEYQA